MNTLKYISSLSCIATVLSMQPNHSEAITPQGVINKYDNGNYRPGNVLAYYNCFNQIIILTNGAYSDDQRTQADILRDAQKNLQDAIFVPIQDIIGLIAEDPTYPDKNSGYMLHRYGTSNKGLTQAVNRNVRNLTEEKLKKSLERYLTYANRDNSQWEKFVYDENAIDRNEDLFQGVANKYRIDPKQLKGRTKENLIHNDIVNQIKGLGEEINLPNANINLRQAAHAELQIQVLWNMYKDSQGKDVRNSIIKALLPKALTVGTRDAICSLFEACDACRKTKWLNNTTYKSIFMFRVLDGQWTNHQNNLHHLTLNGLTRDGIMSQHILEKEYGNKKKEDIVAWRQAITDANKKEENKKKKSNQRRK